MSKPKFPIAFSTIATASFSKLIKWSILYGVSRKYYSRFVLNASISLLAEPFRLVENLMYNRKLRSVILPESPVFILGHWRSGTTLLHNVLCKDDQFAYMSTYQSVFPNQFFTGRWLFKNIMKAMIPEKRPVDNVVLAPDFPQEEGFTLSSYDSFSFYLFWYFPRQWHMFYEKYVECKNISTHQLAQLSRQYKKLIAQALLDQGKKQFISKNPANTGRINQLLVMFPDAKFIYIYRNPLQVFQSTYHFFTAVMESLQLQQFNHEELSELIFELYGRFLQDYEEQKKMIPAHRLIEIRYEDLIADPLPVLQKIYTSLQLENFEKALPAFTSYMNSQNQFEKNMRTIDPALEQKIKSRWQFALDLYGYE